ncbi:MAG: M15 family metallopeptidase [Thermoanaerobaculia bacterium]
MPTDYREIPIPLRRDASTTAGYGHVPVDLDSDLSQEPLVPLAEAGVAAESYYARSDGFNSPYYRALPCAPQTVSCRRSVALKLREVNQRLEPFGLELLAWDGYRPIACQRELWEFFLQKARQALGEASDLKYSRYASRYCSNPSTFNPADPTTWPTHITGGAVDLTLRRIATGELLNMGGTFDDPSRISHTDFFERWRKGKLSVSALDAQRNRRLLYWAMLESDFVNYPFEWWHFDWGTQMWALKRRPRKGARAFYGPADSASG